jgi:hypothetical protein
MALCIISLDRLKNTITKYHSDYNRTQQYVTEVQYLKYQPELITWCFEPAKGFTRGARSVAH